MSTTMTCNQFKQLLDAYLDGELSAPLRLECDTHRLACRECQRWMTMAEAVANTLRTAPDQVPPLRADLADRVLADIGAAPRSKGRGAALKLWIAGLAVAQAAAILAWSLWPAAVGPVPSAAESPRLPRGDVVRLVETKQVVADASRAALAVAVAEKDQVALTEIIYAGIERQFNQMHAAGRTISAEAAQLANFLNVTLPTEVPLDADCTYATVDPLTGLIQSVDAFVEDRSDTTADLTSGGAFRL